MQTFIHVWAHKLPFVWLRACFNWNKIRFSLVNDISINYLVNSMELDQRLPYVNYNFTKEYQTNFGEAVYLSGSLPELGKWDLSKAIRMKCLH